jgi:hypothetical protein
LTDCVLVVIERERRKTDSSVGTVTRLQPRYPDSRGLTSDMCSRCTEAGKRPNRLWSASRFQLNGDRW